MREGPAGPGELAGELHAIARFNGLFGGRRLTLGHVRRLLEMLPADRTATVLDVGTGAADIPVTLVRWARRAGRPLRRLAPAPWSPTRPFAPRFPPPPPDHPPP